MRKIIVVMGGRSPEAPISLNSGLNAFNAVPREKYLPRAVVLTADRRAVLLPEGAAPEAETIAKYESRSMTEAFGEAISWGVEAALLALHGCGGEDGAFQGFLETLGIPYTHSGVLASATAMEKSHAKLLYEKAKVPAPKGVDLVEGEDAVEKARQAGLEFPLIAKPGGSGSSFGLWLFKSEMELRETAPKFWANGATYLLEEFIEGKEFTCVTMSTREGVKAMPVTEIVSNTGALFDYEAKYTKGASQEITPARIDKELSDRIRAAAVRCHQVLGCRGVSRTDFMVRPNGEAYALETNTIPGMSSASILPKVAEVAGLGFGNVIDAMLEEALGLF